MEIKQGDIYWIEQEEPQGSEPGYRRPFVVVQNNLFNHSRIHARERNSLYYNATKALKSKMTAY